MLSSKINVRSPKIISLKKKKLIYKKIQIFLSKISFINKWNCLFRKNKLFFKKINTISILIKQLINEF